MIFNERLCISAVPTYCGDKQITSDEARKVADNWGRWKGLAAYYLIELK